MRNRTWKAGRWIALLALVIGILVGTYAFTAANTVPDTKAGDGSGTITGYVVTGVHYTLNGTDPSKVDAVAFTVDSTPVAGSTLKVQLVSSGTWYTCTNVATAVSCTTTSPQATVVPANQLRVVIAD
jgi:hypothetical protein